MESVKVDRGFELNRKRVQEIEVDIWFRIENERIPAHRLIVSLHSDYLKALTNPSSKFVERDSNEFVLKGISAFMFTQVLQYMYTGSINIRDDNVFDLLESHFFLQMKSESDPLYTKLINYLIQDLHSTSKVNAAFLVRVWNVSETYGEQKLKSAVMDFVDCHLEELIDDHLLDYLGYDEISEILSRPKLCVRSQKKVCDSIVAWILRKRCPENEDDAELTIELVNALTKAFQLTSFYLNDLKRELDLAQMKTEEPIGKEEKGCDNCVFFCTWSRDEKEIRGLDQFLEERKEKQIFMCWDLGGDKNSCKIVNAMRNGRSFHQHYGPIGTKNGCLLYCNEFILYMGGTRMNSGAGNKRHRELVSDEVFTYETSSLSWLRMTSHLPTTLSHFGALYIAPYLYVIGGFTDELVLKEDHVSKRIYRIQKEDWFSSRYSWQHFSNMPQSRSHFSVVNVDNMAICIVSHDVVDIFEIFHGKWRSIERGSGRHGGTGKPLVACLGTMLFIVNSKSSDESSNSIWSLDLAEENPKWQPLLPALDLRFDPVQAFCHDGRFYVIGHQPSLQNFAFMFDPLKKEWTALMQNFSGHLVPHAGILLRRQTVKKAFFDSCQPCI